MEILNTQESESLKKFISDKVMVEAVKKMLLHDIYGAGTIKKDELSEPRRNWVYGLIMNEAGQDYKINNDELGEKVRAIVEGTRALELAFKKIEEFNIEKIEEKIEPNPGS